MRSGRTRERRGAGMRRPCSPPWSLIAALVSPAARSAPPARHRRHSVERDAERQRLLELRRRHHLLVRVRRDRRPTATRRPDRTIPIADDQAHPVSEPISELSRAHDLPLPALRGRRGGGSAAPGLLDGPDLRHRVGRRGCGRSRSPPSGMPTRRSSAPRWAARDCSTSRITPRRTTIPTASADGSTIVFSSNRDGTTDIHSIGMRRPGSPRVSPPRPRRPPPRVPPSPATAGSPSSRTATTRRARST